MPRSRFKRAESSFLHPVFSITTSESGVIQDASNKLGKAYPSSILAQDISVYCCVTVNLENGRWITIMHSDTKGNAQSEKKSNTNFHKANMGS